jgi:hypothetical protein
MIDRDIERTSPEAAGGSPPDQVVLAEYGLDLTKMCVFPLSQNQTSSPFDRKTKGTLS